MFRLNFCFINFRKKPQIDIVKPNGAVYYRTNHERSESRHEKTHRILCGTGSEINFCFYSLWFSTPGIKKETLH